MGWSLTTTGCLPAPLAKPTTVATVASEVSADRTISARRMTGAGDAQCQPMTRSGRSVAAARAEIGNPLKLDARIVGLGQR